MPERTSLNNWNGLSTIERATVENSLLRGWEATLEERAHLLCPEPHAVTISLGLSKMFWETLTVLKLRHLRPSTPKRAFQPNN